MENRWKEIVHSSISKKAQKMRIRSGSIKCDQAVISYLLEFVAIAATNDISNADSLISSCSCLLIPSAFVSGQRTL